MSEPLHIGIAGLGTVGGGTLHILQEHAQLLSDRCGRQIVIAGVSARDKNASRAGDISQLRWYDNPLDMVKDANIAIIVEAIGGADGVAHELVVAALSAGKSVVTANKALIADHGLKLAKLAEQNGATLAFEAAVAGGIPIVKALRDGLSANQFTRIAGILNGSCNYILTAMRDEQSSFDAVLKEAQDKGYAEADPSFDIDGIDTAHKLAILTSLAYGTAPALDSMHVEGIRNISPRDMEFAGELGYTIKLLGITSMKEGGIMQRVHPCMVAKASPLGTVDDVFNAIQVEGDAVGSVFFEGRGAGAGPTGSAVVADIIDVARGAAYPPFILPADTLKPAAWMPMDQLQSAYYLRLAVEDKAGVLASITELLGQQDISVRTFLQKDHPDGALAELVITTHGTTETAMRKALAAIEKQDTVKVSPQMIRIENA